MKRFSAAVVTAAMLMVGATQISYAASGGEQDKAKLAERYGALTQTRRIKQGDAALSFFGFPVEEVNFEPVAEQSLRLDDGL